MHFILTIIFIGIVLSTDDQELSPSAPNNDPKNWFFNAHDVGGSTSQPNAQVLTKQNAHSLIQRWTSLGSGITGAPVVKNNVVYVARFNGTLDAYNINTGVKLWSSGLIPDGQLENSPAIGKYIYLSGRDTPQDPDSDGFSVVAAFDLNNGRLIWKTLLEPDDLIPTGQQICPIVADNLVIVGTNSGQETNVPQFPNGTYDFTFYAKVYALQEKNGQIKWSKRTSQFSHGVSPGFSFAADISQKILYLGTGNAYDIQGPDSCALLSLNLNTGETIFETQLNTDCVWSIAFPGIVDQEHCIYPRDFDVGTYPQFFKLNNDRRVGITDKQRNYTVLNSETGEIIWQTPLIPTCKNPSLGGTPGSAYHNGVIYTLALYDPLNLLTPEVVIAAGEGDFNAIITVLNGYISQLSTTLTALNAYDGTIIWQNTYPGVYFGSPSVTGNGVLLVAGFEGILRILDADTGVELRPPFLTSINPTLNQFIPGARDPANTVATIVDADKVQILIGTGFNFVSGGIYTYGIHYDE